MKRKPDLGRSATVRPTKQPTALGGRTGRDMATVNLRESARAAWEAKESDRVTAARTLLGNVIGPANAAVDAVDVVAVLEASGGVYTVVFVDADGINVSATVRDGGGEVHLVSEGDDGSWTRLGAQVESLAHLWQLIDEHLPAPAYPEWTTQVAYAVGDRVTYLGETYEAIQAHTSQSGWEPPNVPSLWVKVA